MGHPQTSSQEHIRSLQELDSNLIATKVDLEGLAQRSDVQKVKARIEDLLGAMYQSLTNELISLKSEIAKMKDGSEYLTIDQLHQQLKGAIGKRTIYTMCADGRLPAFKEGKRWLIPIDAVNQWKEQMKLK